MLWNEETDRNNYKDGLDKYLNGERNREEIKCMKHNNK